MKSFLIWSLLAVSGIGILYNTFLLGEIYGAAHSEKIMHCAK